MSTSEAFRPAIERLVRRQSQPPHKFGHQPRLYALCQQIGQSLPHDDDIVFAAAWLHDLGIFEGNRPVDRQQLEAWDHVAYACREATRILSETDFPLNKINRVLDVIAEHQPHNEPHSIESTIVRDADVLEQLGAIGILRTAAKLGSDTRFITFSDVERYLERQLEILPCQLRLKTSQDLAGAKVATLRHFLSALRKEAVPELH